MFFLEFYHGNRYLKPIWGIADSVIVVSETNGVVSAFHSWKAEMFSHEIICVDDLFCEIEIAFNKDGSCLGLESAAVGISFVQIANRREILVRHDDVIGLIVDNAGHYVGRFDVCSGAGVSFGVALKTVFSLLCEDRGFLFLHSSSVKMKEVTWLFVGSGGAGKTTIAAELNGGGEPFAVDRVVVAFEEDGTIVAHSTPFSDRDRILKRPLKAPVAGVCFIEQASEHSIRPMEPFEATRELLKQTTAFSRDKARVERTMEAVGRVVDSGMCYKLKFAKDDGFWPLLERAREGIFS